MTHENLLNAAIAYLQKSPLDYMDMLLPIRRGTAEILAADAQGVLLREKQSGAYMLTAQTEADVQRMIAYIPKASLMTVHQVFAVGEAERRFGLKATMRCHQAVWLQPDPPDATPSALDIKPLSPDMAQTVCSLYSHTIGPGYMEGRIAAGEMFGAFEGNALAGFIGLHEEGSMGMLEVVPAFRRRGVGSLLVAHLCGWLMARGLTPFSQFTITNDASRKMHERMGFSITSGCVYWLEQPT